MTRNGAVAPIEPHATVSERVVEAVAGEAGVDPIALDSLYETLDPDALNALFDDTGTNQQDSVRVTFEYAGYQVTVSEGGTVEVGTAVAPDPVTQRDAPSPAPNADSQATD